MKKLITLMFCTALISSAFAQSNHRNDRNNRRYDNNRTVYQNKNYGVYERNRAIERVNREYDYKIQRVSHDRSLNRREKKRFIKSLNAQRVHEIRRINAGYNNGNVYNNRNRRDGDYDQHQRNGRY